jgi:hypothetical protein
MRHPGGGASDECPKDYCVGINPKTLKTFLYLFPLRVSQGLGCCAKTSPEIVCGGSCRWHESTPVGNVIDTIGIRDAVGAYDRGMRYGRPHPQN